MKNQFNCGMFAIRLNFSPLHFAITNAKVATKLSNASRVPNYAISRIFLSNFPIFILKSREKKFA